VELCFDNYNVFRLDRSIANNDYLHGNGVLIAIYNNSQQFYPALNVTVTCIK